MTLQITGTTDLAGDANEGGVIWLSTTDRSQLIGSPAKPTLVTLWSPWSARYTATLSITLNV